MPFDCPDSNCPFCGWQFTAAGNLAASGPAIERGKPSPGDFTLCYSCEALLAFDDNLKVRRLSPMDVANLEGDPKLQVHLALMGLAIRRFKAGKN